MWDRGLGKHMDFFSYESSISNIPEPRPLKVKAAETIRIISENYDRLRLLENSNDIETYTGLFRLSKRARPLWRTMMIPSNMRFVTGYEHALETGA